MTFADIRWDLFLGGLGLFLFGIVIMGDGLKSFAGDKLREYIDKYTSKPLQGLLIGTVMTAVIQSSSATTAICIGFVRAGLMSLEQAAGIIIGANIGTTITAFLIGLNVDAIAPWLIFFGAFALMFAKKKRNSDLARILIGFGTLFYSLSVMSDSLSELKEVPEFIQFAQMCTDNPFIGLFGGIVLTMAMQSSSASIGIIQLFYESGAISFIGVIPFLYGANIGTTITAILASIGGNVQARRAACLHTAFNIIGTIIGFICMMPLYHFMTYLSGAYGIEPMMQIAITHILFNLAATIVVFPFIKQLCFLIRKVVPGEEPQKLEINLDDLDSSNFPVVSAAMSVAYSSINKMKYIVLSNMKRTQDFLNDKSGAEDDFENINENEKVINKVDHKITEFITGLSIDQMSQDTNDVSTLYLEIIKNLERIGDLTVNIAEFSRMVSNDKDEFSKAAYEEINAMFTVLYEMIDDSFHFVETHDVAVFEKLMNEENELDQLENKARKNHFKRMITKECTGAIASSVYADVLSNLERIGDHCCNIARHSFEVKA